MTTICIYIEGGKPKGQPAKNKTNSLKKEMRLGFQIFFSKVFENKPVKVELGGGGSQTCEFFLEAVKEKEPNTVNFLLVDSESPVVSPDRRSHLKRTHASKQIVAQQLDTISERYCHLMVQCMESWFIADEEALKKCFSTDFKVGQIPQIVDVEIYDKDQVNAMLYKATGTKYVADTGRHPGQKETKLLYSGRILKELDPEQVWQKSKHFQQFLKELATELGLSVQYKTNQSKKDRKRN